METKKWLPDKEDSKEAVERVLQRGVLSGYPAPEVCALEDELCQWFDAKEAICTPSGTQSLIVSLMACDLSDNADIIVPSYTFGATAQAVITLGYNPVFVDIKDTYNLDPNRLSDVLTPETEAIIPVHIHGRPCDMEEILRFAEKHNLTVIEDAAQAHGAKYQGQKVGTFGKAGCFSMQSSKHLGIGEGGFILTDDSEMAQEMRDIGCFGFDMTQAPDFEESSRNNYTVYREHKENGGMYNLSEIPAALGRVKLRKLDGQIKKVQNMMDYFLNRTRSLHRFKLETVSSQKTHVWHKIRVGIQQENENISELISLRNRLRANLEEKGIPTTLWDAPILPLQPAFEKYTETDKWKRSKGHTLTQSSFVIMDEDRPLIAQDEDFIHELTASFTQAWKEVF